MNGFHPSQICVRTPDQEKSTRWKALTHLVLVVGKDIYPDRKFNLPYNVGNLSSTIYD
jgi:hypothetical protein